MMLGARAIFLLLKAAGVMVDQSGRGIDHAADDVSGKPCLAFVDEGFRDLH
jgi:hypothetical protein